MYKKLRGSLERWSAVPEVNRKQLFNETCWSGLENECKLWIRQDGEIIGENKLRKTQSNVTI